MSKKLTRQQEIELMDEIEARHKAKTDYYLHVPLIRQKLFEPTPAQEKEATFSVTTKTMVYCP